jgi:hypothetical protein
MDSFILRAKEGTKEEQREKLIKFYCYFSDTIPKEFENDEEKMRKIYYNMNLKITPD